MRWTLNPCCSRYTLTSLLTRDLTNEAAGRERGCCTSSKEYLPKAILNSLKRMARAGLLHSGTQREAT